MRRLLLITILALALLPIGCLDIDGMIEKRVEEALEGLESDYRIEVDGTEELNFAGRYIVVYAAYDPERWVAFSTESSDVSGSISEEYTVVDAVSVGGMFQKLSEEGTLEVKIWRDGELIDSAKTTEPWGAVLVMAVEED